MDARFRIRESGNERVVEASAITIGRQSGSTIVLRDPNVSRLHARVTYDPGGFRLTDAESQNGTFVADRRVVDHPLRTGDEIVLGSPLDDLAGAPRRYRIRVEIEGATCLLIVNCSDSSESNESSEATGSFAVLRAMLFEADDAGRAASGATVPIAAEPPLVAPPVRGKALRRAVRWVPTSDLRSHPWRRGLVLGAAIAAALGGIAVMDAPRAAWLTPSGTSPVHASPTFLAQAGTAGACNSCHTPWHGVADTACGACHSLGTPRPHAALALGCSGCHREHERSSTPGEPIDRHRCTDCHAGAHASPEPAPATAEPVVPARLFLNRPFGNALIHSDHGNLDCARCHEMKAPGEAGQVSSDCASCHGGARGLVDARCFTCHRYHEPAGGARG